MEDIVGKVIRMDEAIKALHAHVPEREEVPAGCQAFYVVAPTEHDFPNGRRRCSFREDGYRTVATCVWLTDGTWQFRNHYGLGTVPLTEEQLRTELERGGTERVEEVLGCTS